MITWSRRALAALAAGALILYCATHMRVESDITAFMPTGSDTAFASLAKHLSESDLSRTLVLTLQADSISNAVVSATQLADKLRTHPEVAWVRDGFDPEQLEDLYDLYFPRRHAFFFEDADADARLSDAGLEESAAHLKRELARPASGLVNRIAPADPLLAFPALVERIRETDRSLELLDGHFVTPDQEYAVVFLGTKASAYDANAQRRLQEDLLAWVAQLERKIGTPITLEQSGGGRFAAQIQASIMGDVRRVMLASIPGVILIFFFFFRSVRTLAIALIPLAGGILAATSVGLWVFGTLNGLAIAFGISLVGVAIDYSVHLLNHSALAPTGERGFETLRRIRPSLILGGLTTLASLVGLGLANFPGFHQMGVLACVGVSTALLITLYGLPDLEQIHGSPFAAKLSSALAGLLPQIGRQRRVLCLVALALFGAGVFAFPYVQWVDDLRELTTLNLDLLAEENRVRDRVSRLEGNRLVIVTGNDWDEALDRNDALSEALHGETQAGTLKSFRSLNTFLWSPARQRRNEERFRADPLLASRLDAAYARQGFQPGAFAPFAAALSEPAAAPLTLEELRSSALGDLIRPLAVELDDQRAVVTYLRDVKDEAAVRVAVESINGATFFDQREFFRGVYGEYRQQTLRVMAIGCIAVLALLWLRYRRLRPSIAAILPSLLVALALTALAAAFGVRANLLHLVGLLLVTGMGVDYGIFVVDSRTQGSDIGVTLLSLMISCLTTLFMFGMLAISEHPILNALGITTAVGISLAFLFAPLALVVLGED